MTVSPRPLLRLWLASALVASAGCGGSDDASSGAGTDVSEVAGFKDLTFGETAPKDATQQGDITEDVAKDDLSPTDTPSTDATTGDLSVPDLGPDLATDLAPDLAPASDLASPPDVAPDADLVPDLTASPGADSDSTAAPDVADPTDIAPDTGPPPLPKTDPTKWGPYPVGSRAMLWYDVARARSVTTQLWYPSKAEGKVVTYLQVIPGKAYGDAPAEPSGGPYPLVLFSHGFKGVNTQSVSMVEFIASHGYIVAAPNHAGNTLFDFTSKDEDAAQAALERPKDVRFCYDQVVAMNAGGDMLSGLVDLSHVAITGHSFGGWTTLLVAGGTIDIAEAKAACAAGSKSDIFCKYLDYWPATGTVKLDNPIPNLEAAIAWAPAGYSSFDGLGLGKGLTGVQVPAMVFGGTLDATAPLDYEITPIYGGVPAPKAKAVLTDGGHMSFTDICSVFIATIALKEFCGVEGMLVPAKAFPAINATSAAWLGYFLKKDPGMKAVLTQAWLKGPYPWLGFESVGL